MIAPDANVVVRFLVADDPRQAERAAALFAHQRVMLLKTVLLETEWVLRSAYALKREDIHDALSRLSRLAGVTIEDEQAVRKALDLFAAGMDFADALHLASAGGHNAGFATFDRKLRSAAAEATGILVITP